MQVLWEVFFQVRNSIKTPTSARFDIVFVRSFVLTKHEKSHVIREEMGTAERHIDIEYVDTDSVEVQEIDYQDEESVKQATDLLLQKELGGEIIEGEVEQEIIQDQEFKVIDHHDIVSVEEHGMVSLRVLLCT